MKTPELILFSELEFLQLVGKNNGVYLDVFILARKASKPVQERVFIKFDKVPYNKYFEKGFIHLVGVQDKEIVDQYKHETKGYQNIIIYNSQVYFEEHENMVNVCGIMRYHKCYQKEMERKKFYLEKFGDITVAFPATEHNLKQFNINHKIITIMKDTTNIFIIGLLLVSFFLLLTSFMILSQVNSNRKCASLGGVVVHAYGPDNCYNNKTKEFIVIN